MIECCRSLADIWNQFWFQTRSPSQIGYVRVAAALIAVIQFVRYGFGASEWFDKSGWFDPKSGLFFIGDGVPGTGSQYRWTLLYLAPDYGWLIALIGLVASSLMLLGIGSRVAPLLSAFALAQFHQRAPFLVSVYEPLLYALLVYLVVDPGQTRWTLRPSIASGSARWSANIALQLVRCHLWIWLALGAAEMLGQASWWNGEAVWQLLRSNHRWIHLSDDWVTFGNTLTHVVIMLQMGTLICMIHPKFRCLGKYFFYALVGCVLLLLGDVIYALVLATAGLAVWPYSRTSHTAVGLVHPGISS